MKKLMGRTMMKMKDNRKNGRKALKGFTLVEIIVVLVILAILAAAMIPALTGYIDKAKNRTLVSEARNAVTAAQTLASEAYGLGGSRAMPDGKTDSESEGYTFSAINDLADVSGSVIFVTVNKGKVSKLIYESKTDPKLYITYTYSKEDGGQFSDPSSTKPKECE